MTPFVASDDPNRCPSRVIYRGSTAARCAYGAGHDGRHHNGTRSWTDRGRGVWPEASSARMLSLGAGHWSAFLATGNPIVLTSATRAELEDALRLARDEVLRLRGPLT